MVRDPGQDANLAGAAHPVLTRGLDGDPRAEQRVERGGVRGHRQRLATAGELDGERGVHGVAAAHRQGYRSRAAFKLEQLDARFRLLRRGMRVADLGCAPGGWSQVALQQVGPGGTVVGVDLSATDSLPGAVLLQGDFRDPATVDAIRAAFGGPVDLVLSDMAAPATGHRLTDHLRIMALCEVALHFAVKVLRPGGSFVAKVLKGGTEHELLAALKRDFRQVRHAKPAASRKESAEAYVVATGFRGAGGSDPDAEPEQDA